MDKADGKWTPELDPTKLPDSDSRWSDLVANSFSLMNDVMAGKRTSTDPQFQGACWVISAYQQRLLNAQIDIAAEQKLKSWLHGEEFGGLLREMMNEALKSSGSDIKVPEGRPIVVPPGMPFGFNIIAGPPPE